MYSPIPASLLFWSIPFLFTPNTERTAYFSGQSCAEFSEFKMGLRQIKNVRLELEHRRLADFGQQSIAASTGVSLHEHRTGTIERSYRWKLQLQRSKINYDLHWHQGTYGLSVRHSWLHGPAKYHLLFAAVDYRGSPVWLGIPAARGYLGAVAIHEDFSGIVAKVAIGPLQIGTTINFENIPKSALQMSYFTSL